MCPDTIVDAGSDIQVWATYLGDMTTATPTITAGWRLRMARERIGLQQAELATIIGVHKNTISNYERDRVGMKASVLKRWADACGVDLTFIMDGVSQRYPLSVMPGRRHGHQPGRHVTAHSSGQRLAA